MELDGPLAKEASRIPRKPERPYMSSLKSSSMDTRRRRLQTYSKRTSSIESTTEPALKRRRVNTSSTTIPQHDDIPVAPSEPEQSVIPPSASCNALPPAKKGTINAYFQKIIPQPLANTSSPAPSSDPVEPTVTPPSSPPRISTRKRRMRRLKTRVATRHVDEAGSNAEDDEDGEKRELSNGVQDGKPATHGEALGLSQTPNALNQSESTSRDGPTMDKRRENRRRRESRTASIQTTLGLSTTEPQYTECKECDMLYNHLHEADVKYHARRHAALRRAKARASAGSEVVE
ncbi:hypothetical protein GGR50DRAFT_546876 [Xylaria sp. CBS 124048]|nr:hypothetical protein GGR50DRAFT_546876 [Xylaria sp. CBS 124048]